MTNRSTRITVMVVMCLWWCFGAEAQVVKWCPGRHWSAPLYGAVTSPSGRIWMADWEKGVYAVDGDSLMEFTRANGALLRDEINGVAVDDSDRVWIAARDLLMSMKDNRLLTYEEYNSPFTYQFKPRYIAYNSKRKCIVGFGYYTDWPTWRAVFFSYEIRNGRWRTWDYGIQTTVGSAMMDYIEEPFRQRGTALDSSGVLYVHSYRLILRFDSDSVRIDTLPFSSAVDYYSFTLPELITDRRGSLWMSNARILCRYDGGQWRTWDTSVAPFKGLKEMPSLAGIALDSALVLETSRYDLINKVWNVGLVSFKGGILSPFPSAPPWPFDSLVRQRGPYIRFYTGRDCYVWQSFHEDLDTLSRQYIYAGILVHWPFLKPTVVDSDDGDDRNRSPNRDSYAYHETAVGVESTMTMHSPFSGWISIYATDGSELHRERYEKCFSVRIPALPSGLFHAVLRGAHGEIMCGKILAW